MSFPSYMDVFGIVPTRYNEPPAIGDLVTSGPNAHPRFRVLAEHDGHCWLRNIDNGGFGHAETNRLRILERAA
jgi:hypothetical protein